MKWWNKWYEQFELKGYWICRVLWGVQDACNEENNCLVDNDGTRGYNCHSKLRSSLYVNTAGPDQFNRFEVLEYGVFAHLWGHLKSEWLC